MKSRVGVAAGMDQTEEAGTGEEGGPRGGAVVISNLANNNPGLVEGEGGAGLNDNDVVAAMNARNLSGSKPQNSVESSEESSEGGRGEVDSSGDQWQQGAGQATTEEPASPAQEEEEDSNVYQVNTIVGQDSEN